MYYPVVTLVGSTKFKDKFIEVQKKLTLDKYIVISVGLFGHSGDSEAMDEETKKMLDDMHLHKIDMCDIVYVINHNGYIGDSTRREIAYALSIGKEVKFLNPVSSDYFYHNIESILDDYPEFKNRHRKLDENSEEIYDIIDKFKKSDRSLKSFKHAANLTPQKMDRMLDVIDAEFECMECVMGYTDPEDRYSGCPVSDCDLCCHFRHAEYLQTGYALVRSLLYTLNNSMNREDGE